MTISDDDDPPPLEENQVAASPSSNTEISAQKRECIFQNILAESQEPDVIEEALKHAATFDKVSH